MQPASGAGMNSRGVQPPGQLGRLGGTARIEQMQKGRGGRSGPVNAQEAVPERVERYGGGTDPGGLKLPVDGRQTLDAKLQQRFGVRFHAAIVSGFDLIGEMLAEAWLLLPAGIEQQRPDAGRTHIQGDDMRAA